MRRIISILIVPLITILGCKEENRYFDKHGNEIIEKGDEISIIPSEYKKTGEPYKIFLFNETEKSVNIADKFTLHPNEKKIFKFADSDSMFFDIGPKIYFGDFGLEIEDKRSQLAGIGGEYWDKYNVPDDVEYGFVIVPPGEGDTATK